MTPFNNITVFDNLTLLEIIFVIFIHFAGFYIRGILGFGSNMPIVLLTTWILGPHHAILLVALTSSIAQFHLLPQGVRHTDWPVARMLSVGMMVGIILGTWTFTEIEADWLTLLLSMIIIVILVMDRFRLMEQLQLQIDLRAYPVASILAIVSGTIGTITGGGALYFLVGYLKLVCANSIELRSTNAFLSGGFMLFRLGLLSYAGLFTPALLVESLVVAPAVFLGSWAGTKLFHTLSPERFYNWLQLILSFAAVTLLFRGLIYLNS